MRVDVLLGEAPVASADVADRVVIVIDVLRAATTAAVALTNGARAMVPCETVELAAQQAKAMDQDTVRLGGERHMVKIPGFDFGNSPLEYTADRVHGRTIVFTTTNGTVALVAAQRARECLFAAFVNVSATLRALQQVSKGELDIVVACAGTDRQVSLEDVVCAGRLVRGMLATYPDITCGDGARVAELIERPYQDSLDALSLHAAHAKALSVAGFAEDVACCFAVDTVPAAVSFRERQLRLFTTAAH